MNPSAKLSNREYEIAAHLSWGATKKEIARKLYISVRTVENTARNIYEKIQVNNVAQLVAWMFCKKFNKSMVINPLLSAFFMMLVGATTLKKEYNRNNCSTREDYCNGRMVNETTTC